MNKPIRILLADDHTIVRKGLCSILESEEGIEVVGEAEDGREAIQKVKLLNPHVVVMDISMPSLNGLEATRQIRKQYPKIKVLILSMHANEEYIFQTLRAGASGYLVKKAAPKDLVLAIQSAFEGEIFLSPSISKIVVEGYIKTEPSPLNENDPFETLTKREREILQLLAEGVSNHSIAEKLYLSVKTVQTHRANILGKLNVHSLTDLIKIAFNKGMISLDT